MSAPVMDSHPLPAPEVTAALEETLHRLLDKLLVLLLTLGTVALAAPVLRTWRFGWMPEVTLDALTYLFVLLVILLRRRLGASRAFGAVVALIWLNGFTSLCSYGLLSTGVLIMSAAVTIGAVVFGKRVGWSATALSLVAMGAVGLAFRTGVLHPLKEPLAFMASVETWATHAITLALYAATLTVVVQSIHRRASDALAELRVRTSALESSERQYRLLAESTTDMVFVQDLVGNLTYVSPSALAITGFSAEELLHLPPAARFTPESWRRAEQELQYYRSGAETTTEGIPPLLCYEFCRKDHSTFWGEVRGGFLRDATGNIYALQGTLRDISERLASERSRHDLEEKMLAMEKMRAIGQLAGGVAHDFNNQLAVILGYAGLLARSTDLPERLRTAVERITESGAAAADLTGKLLSLSRPAPGKVTRLDGAVLLQNVAAMLEHAFPKDIQLRLELAAGRHKLRGDRGQLESALLNLALNARDAMPTGGTLTFATRIRPSVATSATTMLELTVRDTGTGMTPEVLRRAMEPFFTTKPLGQGTGLGLSLVYGTVTAHGGHMRLKSELGHGTEVTLLLPVLEAETDASRAIATGITTGCERILLLDDDPAVCAVTGDLLRELGYKVLSFTAPRDALEHAFSHHDEFDLVLTDLLMPELNGLQLCTELRQRLPSLPVLVYSGKCDDKDEAALRDAGACGILRKPFDICGLSAAVRSALGARPD